MKTLASKFEKSGEEGVNRRPPQEFAHHKKSCMEYLDSPSLSIGRNYEFKRYNATFMPPFRPIYAVSRLPALQFMPMRVGFLE